MRNDGKWSALTDARGNLGFIFLPKDTLAPRDARNPTTNPMIICTVYIFGLCRFMSS